MTVKGGGQSTSAGRHEQPANWRDLRKFERDELRCGVADLLVRSRVYVVWASARMTHMDDAVRRIVDTVNSSGRCENRWRTFRALSSPWR